MEYGRGSAIFYFESFFQTYSKFSIWNSSYPQAVDDLEGLVGQIADNMNTFATGGRF